MTKKAVEEQQTLKRERYESRYAEKKTAATCGAIMRHCQLKGGTVGAKKATLPVRGYNNYI